jgi:hypothetical protein
VLLNERQRFFQHFLLLDELLLLLAGSGASLESLFQFFDALGDQLLGVELTVDFLLTNFLFSHELQFFLVKLSSFT